MKYAVVIPSLYSVDKEYLKLCVISLRDSGFEGQIIVVTNGKPEPFDVEGVTIHLHINKQGQCRAVNAGVQVVSPDTDYIMVTNSDMYYAPGWDKHLRFDYPVFSPNLVEPTDNNGSAPPFIKFDGGLTTENFQREKVDMIIKHWTDMVLHEGMRYEFDGQFMWDKSGEEPGFNLPFFIRKDVWDTIGGYDEKYDPWGSNSDTDLQTKINLAGITPMRLRDVLVYHFSNKSGTFDGTHNAEWQANFDYYRQKWGYTRDDEPKADVWYNQNMILPDKLIYHPDWEDKYA